MATMSPARPAMAATSLPPPGRPSNATRVRCAQAELRILTRGKLFNQSHHHVRCSEDVVVNDQNQVMPCHFQAGVNACAPASPAIVPENSDTTRSKPNGSNGCIVNHNDICVIVCESLDALRHIRIPITGRYDDCQIHPELLSALGRAVFTVAAVWRLPGL